MYSYIYLSKKIVLQEALSRKEESDGRIRAWEIRKEEKHKEFEQQQTILEEQRIV